jgi:hypothetical protein
MGFRAVLEKYNTWWRLQRFALSSGSTLRRLGSEDPSDYYTVLGDDVIITLNGNFEDMSKPLWLNLG